jgi:hypothetical protein
LHQPIDLVAVRTTDKAMIVVGIDLQAGRGVVMTSPTLVDEDEEEVETKVALADLTSEPIIGGKTRCPF